MKQLALSALLALGLFACSNYGDKVSKENLEVYYKDGATKEEAQKTLDKLYNKEDKEKKSLQLSKSGDTINFKMVIDEKKMKDLSDDDIFLMSHYLSDTVYNGAPVNIIFADNKFVTIRTVAFRKITLNDEYGDPAKAGKIEVYSRGGFSLEHAQQMADYIQTQLGEQPAVTQFIIGESTAAYEVSLVKAKDKLTMDEAALNKLAADISNNVFNGSAVLFEVIDDNFKTYKTLAIANPRPVVDTVAVTR